MMVGPGLQGTNGQNIRSTAEVIKFLRETGTKLGLEEDVIVAAAVCFHKFVDVWNIQNHFFKMVIAASSLLVSGRAFYAEISIDTIVTAFYETPYISQVNMLHHDDIPLLQLMEFIKKEESFLLLFLEFSVPKVFLFHYVLYYWANLHDLFSPALTKQLPIADLCLSLMWFCLQTDICIKYNTKHLAITVVYLALNCFGITVPGCNTPSDFEWTKVFSRSISLQSTWAIIEDIINASSALDAID